MKTKKKFPKFMSALLAVVMIISALPMSAFAAVASDLPANMKDHSILRALEYTGYDVQKQIKDGTLYQSGSYGSRTPSSVNYPVMQSPDNPNFYLKHGFDKGYTDYGCPYVSEECDVNKPSDNLIIYGHNMKNGSMFSALNQFKSKNFWEKHRAVYFNNLYEKQTYEIVAVFKTVVYTDSANEFRYYRFIDAQTPEQFGQYFLLNLIEHSFSQHKTIRLTK